ncbi:hypothetical protein RIVM261_017050 [Rivularia sp. IAM M-261]|nr:hypothetical protein RIVM261_017050 [Rivularia sp. IAM M-261]
MQYHDITNLVDLLNHREKYQPDGVAFSFLPDGETEEASISYKNLDKKARAIASVLQSMKGDGSGKAERALLLYQPGLEFIAAFFGCLYARVIAVPVYPPKRNQHNNRLQAIISDAQATIVLTSISMMSDIEKSLKQEPESSSLRYIITDTVDSNNADYWQPL